MDTTITTKNGKRTAEVRHAGRVVYRSPQFITGRMALADAKCWIAFHGGEDDMSKVQVDPAEVYTARDAVTQEFEWVPAEVVARKVANAYEYGLTVEIKDGAMGQQYIQISNGKGSSYGIYHIGAAFRAKVLAA